MNDEKEKRCFFWNGVCNCRILSETQCDGHKQCCTFRKTASQYASERDKAIKINRKRGLCRNCKYVPYPCQLSTEGEQ